MNIDEIMRRRAQLDKELAIALTTMDRKDNIQKIREQILANQNNCPHYSEKYNYTRENNICPYCGKHEV